MTVADAINKGAVALSEDITLTLKQLLETKHLYQSITTSFKDEILKTAVSGIGGFQTKLVETDIGRLYGGSWHVWQPSQEWKGPLHVQMPAGPSKLAFKVPHVKLFCHKCGRVEAFNYLFGQDSLDFGTAVTGVTPADNQPTTQIFVFSFHCQSCKGIPEVFLVRREGNKLTLSGRSPIEHVEHLRVIPKAIARFFSGAVVAHQSGQTLAGVFLLRVLIEQWVQSQAKIKNLKVDQALDEYFDALPEDFKKRFPSLRILYSDLSVDIHSATGSAELFEKTQQQIIEHFEARRLYKL